MKKKSDRYFMSAVKIGPKGQIVIPKERCSDWNPVTWWC